MEETAPQSIGEHTTLSITNEIDDRRVAYAHMRAHKYTCTHTHEYAYIHKRMHMFCYRPPGIDRCPLHAGSLAMLARRPLKCSASWGGLSGPVVVTSALQEQAHASTR